MTEDVVQGDLLFFGVTQSMKSSPRIIIRVFKENGGEEFKLLFLKSVVSVSFSEPRLEFEIERKGLASSPVLHTTVSVRLFFPGVEYNQVLRRAEIVKKILEASKVELDLRIFPLVATSVPIYAQSALDQYESHRINEEIQAERHQCALKAKRAMLTPGPLCSKRAKGMLLALHRESSQTADSKNQSNRNPNNDWMKSMKVAQGRAGFKSQNLQALTPQNKIYNYFGPRSNLEGFKNLGNTCYISAIVSVLLSLPALAADVERFCQLSQCKNDSSARLLNAFRELFQQVKEKNHGVLNLASLKDAISSSAKRFAGREQHDAHEFYSSCIDLLTTELQQIAKKRSSSSPSKSLSEPTSPTLQDLIATDRNLLLRVRHTLVCANADCAYRRSRRELFRDVSLCIPDHDSTGLATLDGLLDAFFADNHLEYTCDKCGHGFAKAVHKVLWLCD
jgi:hypothetical protein